MSTINKAQEEHLMGKCPEQNKKSIGDAVTQIKDIIKDREDQYFRIAALQRIGYTVSYEWVKGNELGRVTYMKRKKQFRVQVTEVVQHGDYHKAYVVILPEKNYSKNDF